MHCSEAMLGEARQYFQQDRTLDPSRYLLLRADVGRMPFATGSGAPRGKKQRRLACVHAVR